MIPRFVLAGLFLLGGLLAGGLTTARATEDWLVWHGTPSDTTLFNTRFKLAIHNPTSAPVIFRYAQTDGLPRASSSSTVPIDITGSISHPGTLVVAAPANFTTSVTVAAGATVYADVYMSLRVGEVGPPRVDVADSTGHTYNMTMKYFDGSTFQTRNFQKTNVTLVYKSSPPLKIEGYGASGYLLSGIYYPLWGTIELGAPPAHGWLSLRLLHGPFRGKIVLDGATVLNINETGLYPTAPAEYFWPRWETNTPSAYAGKSVKMYVNDKLVYTGTITLDINGNFDIVRTLTDAEWPDDYDASKPGEQVPDVPDPSHNRPDPGPLDGPDPKTDTTPNDTVQDEYRAVRAAIEDANSVNNGEDAEPDFDKWAAKTDKEKSEQEDPRGAGFGNKLGGGMDALKGLAPKTIGLGDGSVGSISLHSHLGTMTIVPPVWSSVIRSILLIFVLYVFWQSEISIIRGAFAGK